MYTITAAVATLFQTAILHNKRVRKILNLPPVAGGDGQAPAKGMLGIKLMPKDVINRAIKDTKTRRILNQKLVHDGANSRNAADQKLKSSNA